MGDQLQREGSPVISLPPFALLAVFTLVLSICCGPPYNQNAFKSLLRTGDIIPAPTPDSSTAEHLSFEADLSYSLKTFQTADLVAGPIAGWFLDFTGPRLTMALGQLVALLGICLMLLSDSSLLWVALAAQGIAIQLLLNPALCISNLFTKGGKVSLSLLSGSADLSTFLFPLFLAIPPSVFTPLQLFYILIGVSVAGFGAAVLFLPDHPFNRSQAPATPASLEADDTTTHYHRQGSEKQAAAVVVNLPNEKSSLLEGAVLVKHGDSGSLSPTRGSQDRASALAQSLVALASSEGDAEENRDFEPTLMSQLLSVGYLSISLVFVFFVVRMNLYLDANESILKELGDDGTAASVFGWVLPFAFVTCLINGLCFEYFGVLETAIILNTLGTLVNLLSIMPSLQLQYLTFVIFTFYKSALFTTLFAYIIDFYGLSNLGMLAGMASVTGGVVNELVGKSVLGFVQGPCGGSWTATNYYITVAGVLCYIPLMALIVIRRHRRKHNKTVPGVASGSRALVA